MQVYKITPTVSYAWGCALVAADNREQAIETYRKTDEHYDYEYDDLKCVCNIVDKLHYYCEKSTVILSHIGAE